MFSERTTLQRLLLLKALSGGGQSLVERTALGNPLTFGTDVSKPLKSLLIPFTPQQSGTGDPSPSNIRSIIPWDGLTVWRGGGNLMPHPTKGNGVNPTTGASTTDATRASTDFIPVNFGDNNTYTFSGICDTMNSFVASYNANKQFLGRTIASSRTGITVTKSSFTSGTAQGIGDIAYLRFAQAEGSSGHSIDEIDDYDYMMNVGSSAMPYEEYKPITETDISFPSPVYGGEHEAVSGALKSVYASDELTGLNVASYGTASTGVPYVRMTTQSVIKNNGKVLCDSYKTLQSVPQQGNSGCRISNQTLFIYDDRFTSESVAKELLTENPIQCVYELATPTEQTLTGHQITALKGDNTIWSDADGSMTCVYLVSSKYAEEHPVGGLGSGLGSGLLGSVTEDNPEDPAEDPIEDPEEEIPDNTEEGSESDD